MWPTLYVKCLVLVSVEVKNLLTGHCSVMNIVMNIVILEFRNIKGEIIQKLINSLICYFPTESLFANK